MMRSMVLEFEKDLNCRYLDRQYMLGDSLLVAPVFNEDGEAQYYLPQGTWTNYLTGETAEGGCWRTEKHDYLSVPFWARENSIIPTGIKAERADYEFSGNMELKVFALKDKAQTCVYQNREEPALLELVREGADIRGNAAGMAGCTVRFVNCILTGVQGAEAETEGNDTVITVEKDGTFTCTVQQ